MKIKFNATCMGYYVGGRDAEFLLEIKDEELIDLSEDEKEEYILECIHEEIINHLDYGFDIIKE